MTKDLLFFKNKERKTRSEVADFLHQLAEKVSDGKVQLRQGQDEVFLDLPSNVILEVEVKDKEKGRRGIQHKLEIELKWYDGDDGEKPLELG